LNEKVNKISSSKENSFAWASPEKPIFSLPLAGLLLTMVNGTIAESSLLFAIRLPVSTIGVRCFKHGLYQKNFQSKTKMKISFGSL